MASSPPESDTLEYKTSVSKSFCATVIAFANCEGGRILVGVNNDGMPLGVDDVDSVMLQISHIIADSICPEILHFVAIEPKTLDGKTVIEVSVEGGDRKPYCLASKGFTPAGVYMRVGPGNVHASADAIRSMIRMSDGDVFEQRRSEKQGLSFDEAHRFFANAGIALADENLKSLRAVGLDGYATNLGLLLSDQCPFAIKCAVYGDENGLDYIDRRSFTGSVLTQLNDALAFLELSNTLHATFEGLRRIDEHAVPPRAIREALVNAVMHRDYDYDAPVIVNVFSNRIEFVSTGSLVKGLTRQDITAGVSATRNPLLASVLLRLSMAEGYGMGIRIMRGLYDGSGLEPELIINPGSFVTVLPKRTPDGHRAQAETGQTKTAQADREKGSKATVDRRSTSLTNGNHRPAAAQVGSSACPTSERKRHEYDIVRFAEENGEVRRADIEKMLGISRDAALALVEGLVLQGTLEKRGKSRGTRYVPVRP